MKVVLKIFLFIILSLNINAQSRDKTQDSIILYVDRNDRFIQVSDDNDIYLFHNEEGLRDKLILDSVQKGLRKSFYDFEKDGNEEIVIHDSSYEPWLYFIL